MNPSHQAPSVGAESRSDSFPLEMSDIRLLEVLATGATVPDLARQLGCDPATTRIRIDGVKTKLGARTTIHAAYLAAKAGLI